MKHLRRMAALLVVTSIAVLVPTPAHALESNDRLVQSWYVHFLQRSPADAARDPGRNHWVQLLDSDVLPKDVLPQILESPEYVQRQVSDSYRAILGRGLDPLAEVWTKGPTQPDPDLLWLEWVDLNLLASDELYSRWASRPNRDDLYVQQLYVHVLGRHAWQTTPGERAWWVARIHAVGRLNAVRDLWYTEEAVTHRLMTHYRSLLGLTSVDPGDLRYWYNEETGSDLKTQLALASSARYQNRVHGPITLTYRGQLSFDEPGRGLFDVAVGTDSRRHDVAAGEAFGTLRPLSTIQLVSQTGNRQSAVVRVGDESVTLNFGVPRQVY